MDRDDGRRCGEAEGERSDGAVAGTRVDVSGDEAGRRVVGDAGDGVGDGAWGDEGVLELLGSAGGGGGTLLLGDRRGGGGRRGDEGDGEEFAGQRGGIEVGDEDD